MEIKNIINPEEHSHKFGISKKELYKQIIRFDKIIGKDKKMDSFYSSSPLHSERQMSPQGQ